jgi:hypothetical protein
MKDCPERPKPPVPFKAQVSPGQDFKPDLVDEDGKKVGGLDVPGDGLRTANGSSASFEVGSVPDSEARKTVNMSSVFSTILEVKIGAGTVLEGEVSLTFKVPQSLSNASAGGGDYCLAFLNETTNQLHCQDRNLTLNSVTSEATGKTDHLSQWLIGTAAGEEPSTPTPTPTPSSGPSPTPTATPKPSDDATLDTGMIAAIAGGAVVGIIVFSVMKKACKKNPKKPTAKHPYPGKDARPMQVFGSESRDAAVLPKSQPPGIPPPSMPPPGPSVYPYYAPPGAVFPQSGYYGQYPQPAHAPPQ